MALPSCPLFETPLKDLEDDKDLFTKGTKQVRHCASSQDELETKVPEFKRELDTLSLKIKPTHFNASSHLDELPPSISASTTVGRA